MHWGQIIIVAPSYFISFARVMDASISTLRMDTLSILQPIGIFFCIQKFNNEPNIDLQAIATRIIYPLNFKSFSNHLGILIPSHFKNSRVFLNRKGEGENNRHHFYVFTFAIVVVIR